MISRASVCILEPCLNLYVSLQCLLLLRAEGTFGISRAWMPTSGSAVHRFCKTRFFSDSELFIHMQSAHEQCFLCRRAHPDRYIYYKDYNELEGNSYHHCPLYTSSRTAWLSLQLFAWEQAVLKPVSLLAALSHCQVHMRAASTDHAVLYRGA